MSREDNLLGLIGGAYRAALEPDAWPNFLRLYADATGSSGAALHWFDKDPVALVGGMNSRLRSDGVRAYTEYYCKNDPRAVFAFAHPPGTVFVDYDLMTEAEMNRSEYYEDFLRGEGLRYCLATAVFDEAGRHCGIAVHRSARQGPYDASDLPLARVLAPHLRRAVEMQVRLRIADVREHSLLSALDGFAMGVILVDARARPLLTNRAADEILRQGDGVRATKEGLEAATLAETARLRRAVFEAAQTGAGRGVSAGAAMRLARPSARRPLELLVSPLPRHHHRLGGADPAAVVFVGDPERRPRTTTDLLAELHGLTHAEAELAAALLAGQTLAEFAADTGRRTRTVRKTLNTVFAKTDTSRQAELVRLLLTGPAALGPLVDSLGDPRRRRRDTSSQPEDDPHLRGGENPSR